MSAARMHLPRISALALAFATIGCRPAATAPSDVSGIIELTQSVPSATNVSMQGYRATDDAWRALIDGAKDRLDLAFFYASDEAPSRLTPIVQSVLAARKRGVKVRAVFERVFISQYPDIPRTLQNADIAVRVVDRARTTGGIVHTKMMAADGKVAWVGSANFDWRSLDHIHELGVLVAHPALAESVHTLIGYDVDLGDSERPKAGTGSSADTLDFVTLRSPRGVADVAFAASPRDWLPQGIPWDWSALEQLIASAEHDLTVEFLSYGVVMRDGRPWNALDDAIRGAVARGVHVTLVVSSWAEKGKHRSDLLALRESGVDVRIVTIPEHPKGPIPFARVIHGKTVVADGARCWVGTSNGEGDYFLKSRNAGFFLRSEGLCGQLRGTVQSLGSGPYGADIAPSLPRK